METAKIFENGRSQAIRLPKKFRFNSDTDEVIIRRLGKAILLVPKEEAWATFMQGVNTFSDDFMKNGRDADYPQERESL